MTVCRPLVALMALAVLMPLMAPGPAAADTFDGAIGPELGLTANGRQLRPAGRQTAVGNFPTGGALTPDGRFYWVVDSGHGRNDVQIVDVATGAVRQTLPLPGGNGGVAFAPDGTRAYVSGLRTGSSQPEGPTKGPAGDVVHVFAVDRGGGGASEEEPIPLPQAGPGSAQTNSFPPVTADLPGKLAVSPDGRRLAVVLTQADRLAVVDLATREVRTVAVGAYPHGVAITPDSRSAYVSNEYDGTLSVVDLEAGSTRATVTGLGGERGDRNSHPEGLVADPARNRVYVAVANRDLVAVVDTERNAVIARVSVARGALGVQPVALAVAPDARTLYSADAGEDAVAAIALTDRPSGAVGASGRPVVRLRSEAVIARYRARVRSAQRRLARDLRRVRRDRRRSASARKRAIRRRRAVHRRELTRLRRTLSGPLVTACAGPSRADESRWTAAVLRARVRRERDLARARKASARRRARLRRGAARRYAAALRAARRRLPPIQACAGGGGGGSPDDIPGLAAFTVIGKLPTAAYPTDVAVTPDGGRLLWTAAKGYGAGPNPDFLMDAPSPYGSYVPDKLIGRVGVLPRPGDRTLRAMTPDADAQTLPADARGRPAGNPVPAAGQGPSEQIQHVFYIVRENRTYDQVFGREPRGDGAPGLELFGDNGVAGPTGGITPNAHELARTFPLLDHVYANSEVSVDGHLITAGAIATDYVQRATQLNYSNRGRAFDFGIWPVTFGPNAFVFDQAARQGVSFFNYGEQAAGVTPPADDGRPTYAQVVANTDQTTYAGNIQIGCPNPVTPATRLATCTQDSGIYGGNTTVMGVQRRFDAFRTRFEQQVAAGQVPKLNYLILPNNHTNGTQPNAYTPQAMIADNDLALGQIVDLVSHSPIWASTAIFVIEDDTQDGADHIDAHRMPAFVISPWARSGPVHARYDQYSVLRTIGLIIGLEPLSINDALATPMYDAFLDGGLPRTEETRYTTLLPEQPLDDVNSANAANAGLSARLDFDKLDSVPQNISDRILWQSAHGRHSKPPPPGPNASPAEHARAEALEAEEEGR